jgi:hypothetical protein
MSLGVLGEYAEQRKKPENVPISTNFRQKPKYFEILVLNPR